MNLPIRIPIDDDVYIFLAQETRNITMEYIGGQT